MKKNLRARTFAPALSLVALACGAAWGESFSEIDPVVVTATRVAQPLSQTLSSVSVITREDIDRAQVSSLADLLQGEPGFEFARNGGPGTTTSFFMRGQASTNVVVMVDGVRAQTDSIGSLTLTDFPLGMIERIEILRGNASALYGEAAIGGVIQIFTRESKGEPKAYGSISYGSRNTSEVNAGYAGNVNGYKFNLNAGGGYSDGFSAMNPVQKSNANPSKDPYSQQYASFKVEKKLGSDVLVGLRASNSLSSTYYDNAFATATDISRFKIENNVVGAFLKAQLQSNLTSQLDVASTDYIYSDYLNGTLSSYGKNYGHQDSVRWNNTLKMGDLTTLDFGVDQISESFRNPEYFGSSYDLKRESFGYFAGLTQVIDKLTVQANMRHDDVKVRGDMYGAFDSDHQISTGLLGIGYQLTSVLRLTTNASTGFRAPDASAMSTNPLLKSEVNESREAGIVYSESNTLVRAVYFESDTKNAITYDSTTYAYSNVGDLKNHGVELTAKTLWQDNLIKASYVQQNPWDETNQMQALRRAKEYGSLDLSRPIGVYSVGTKVIAEGSRTDLGNQTLAGFATVGLYSSRKINDDWIARLKVDNVFDRQYQLAYGYNTPGRGVYLTLQYQPK